MGEDVEEQREDTILRSRVGARVERLVRGLHRGDLALAVSPRRERRKEDIVVALAGTSRHRMGRFSYIVMA
jgi:hypothetical protein